MAHLLYWTLAFKLACDEVLGVRSDPRTVQSARDLHRRLYA